MTTWVQFIRDTWRAWRANRRNAWRHVPHPNWRCRRGGANRDYV